MSDVTEAPTQDQIAESLLGDESEQQTAVEQPETEQTQEVVETQEQPQEQQQQEQVEEVAENWLPSEQDKVFPDEVYARYAERYNLSPEQAADPQFRQLLHDKINSDIFIQQQQQQQQEQYEPEPEQPLEPTQQPQVSREQYFQNLDRVIAERTDPEVAKSFHSEFLKAFGVQVSSDGKHTIETNAQGQRVMVPIPEGQAMQFTATASKYMLNLMNTFMGDILGAQLSQQISQAFPGFGDMYDRSSHAMAWDRVRNSDPSFANLPAYGTKQFSSTLREAAARIPGFDEMQFTDQQGRPLPAQQNAERKYAMLAKIASGQNVNPQLLQQAAAAGARNARRADVRRSAGNLGSGKSNAATGGAKSSKFQTNDDLFDEDTMARYQQEHGRL
jgi:hypothetical protein